LRFSYGTAPDGKREHLNHENPAVQGQRYHLPNINIDMPTRYGAAINANMAFADNLLGKRAAFGEPCEEQELVEPHRTCVNSVASWQAPRKRR
jgi:hypothetical protein